MLCTLWHDVVTLMILMTREAGLWRHIDEHIASALQNETNKKNHKDGRVTLLPLSWSFFSYQMFVQIIDTIFFVEAEGL